MIAKYNGLFLFSKLRRYTNIIWISVYSDNNQVF